MPITVNNNQVDSNALAVLDGISSTNTGPELTVNDFRNVPLSDLSPDQQAEFDQLSRLERNPATGPLSLSDYYPDAHNPIAVGNYSGSEIGSTTLFAPGGGLVPLGMMDARESAIQKAAFQKAKELDSFRNMYKSPTTKLVNVQPELTKGYNEFLTRRMDEAKRKYGRQWTKGLEQDPAFLAENQSWQDLAKYGDDIVSKTAQLDEALKTGRYTATPSLLASKKFLYSAADPTNPEFKKFGDRYRAFQLDLDFNDVFNETVKELQMQQDAKAGIDVTNPNYIATREKTTEYYNPETIEAAVQSMKAQFPNSDYYTPDYIEKNVRARMSAVREKKDVSVQQKREGYGDTDYSQEIPQVDKALNATIVTGQQGTGKFDESGKEIMEDIVETVPVYSDYSYNTKAKDHQKELSFVLSDEVTDLSGNKLNEESGNIKGQVQSVGVFPYDSQKKRFLTTDEVKSLKDKNLYYNNHNIKLKAGAVVNATSTKDEKAGERNITSIVVPASDVEGKLSKGLDEKIKEVKEKAASMKKAEKKVDTKPASKPATTVNDLRKKYNY